MSDTPPLLRLANLIDTLNTRFGQGCAWLTLFLVIGTAIVVVLRYGFGIGAITYVIRTWGGYPDGLAFAVLLMNLCAPTIDEYTQPRVYGHGRRSDPR